MENCQCFFFSESINPGIITNILLRIIEKSIQDKTTIEILSGNPPRIHPGFFQRIDLEEIYGISCEVVRSNIPR